MLEFRVYGTPLGSEKEKLYNCYEPSRWQWAEKEAQFLRDKGILNVEVREDDDGFEEDDEDEDEENDEQGDELCSSP